MEPRNRYGNHEKGRVKRLLDRLAALLKRLPPDRQQAALDHLREQGKNDREDENRIDAG